MSARARVGLLLLAALGGGAMMGGTAAARPFVSGLDEQNDTLQLARGGLAFVESRQYRNTNSGQYLVELKRPDEKTQVLTRIRPAHSKRFGWPEALDFEWAVSEQATVVAKEEMQTEGTDEAGNDNNVAHDSLDAYDGAGKRILRLKCLRSISFALADSALASFGDGCRGRVLTIRDLSAGGRVVRSFADGSSTFDAVLLAGDVVAYATGDNGLSVANWRTGSLLYHLERPDLDPYQVALGADGTVVALLGATGLDNCGRAVVFDPLNTSGRELPQHICELSPRLIGRQVAFVTGRFSHWSVAVADIDTGAGHTVARIAGLSFAGFDFDGAHSAWDETRCQDHAIFRQAAGAPTHPASPVRCPARFGRRALRVTGRGRAEISVPVHCPHGCTLEAYMRIPGLPYALAGAVRARPGRPAALLFRTDAGAWRRLRRIGSTRVRIDVRSYEPSGQREYHRRLRLRAGV